MLPFALTIFLGAFLLFQVQPLIGKFILPWFGGTPAVWTTCLLFFQVLLLGGYTYAHLVTRWLSRRTQAVLHTLLVGTALWLLPIVPGVEWKPSPGDDPMWRILRLLTVCLGVPYFALSATGPLLQAWFADVKPGTSPYRLYALSNVGSLLALLSFPFLFEPAFSRQMLATTWGWGFGAYAVLALVCAALAWRSRPAVTVTVVEAFTAALSDPPPALVTRGLWLGLPACASMLLMATTNSVCQDVAVVPFLWVLPLSLYLLSFVLCFDSPQWYWRGSYHRLLVFMVGAIAMALHQGWKMPLLWRIGIYGVGLFVMCMVCHGELYRLKPHPRHLTYYYLMLAAGGALGGLAVAVIAPLVFNSYLELHCGLVLCFALLAGIYAREQIRVGVGRWSAPAWGGALVGVVVLLGFLGYEAERAARSVVSSERNFYGVIRVVEDQGSGPEERFKFLRVGDIIHGLQFTHSARERWPLGYYSEESGVGLAMRHLLPARDRRMAFVGLGVGTLATYAQAGDTVRFYEINPAVEKVARDQFTFLKECRGRVELAMGDARLSLEREPPQQFDLMALDAFSGDAVPVHLLTQEAFECYLRHLKPEGVLAVHISNQHLDLTPVVRSLASHFHLRQATISHKPANPPWWIYRTRWVLLTRSAALLDHEAIRAAAAATQSEAAGPSATLWTDDHASLFQVLQREH